jgi:transposase
MTKKRDAVIAAIDAGMSTAEAAVAAGCSISYSIKVSAMHRAATGSAKSRWAGQEDLRAALLKGMTAQDAAIEAGCSIGTAFRYATSMRKRGELPKYQHPKSRRDMSLDKALRKEDAPFREWLLEQVPDGGTLAELLIAFARDVYHEEKELGE